MRRKHLLQPDSNTPTFCLIGELLQEFFSFRIFWTSNSHTSHRGHNITCATYKSITVSQTYDIFIYRLFLFSFEQRNQKDCRPIVFYKAKTACRSFKAIFTLKQHRPIPAAKKSFAYKNFIYNQNPLSLKASQKGCDNLFLTPYRSRAKLW